MDRVTSGVDVTLQFKNKNLHILRQVAATVGSCFMIFSLGATNGLPTVLIPQLKDDPEFLYEKKYESWIASVVPLTEIIGALSAGTIIDVIGRRSFQMLLTTPFFVGWLIVGLANDSQILITGRIITGILSGSVKPSTYVFLGELIDAKHRGIILFFPSLAFDIGIVFCHTISKFVHWKINAFLCGVPLVCSLVLMSFMKESPQWLISKDKTAEGLANFRWYRGDSEEALKEIQGIVEKQTNKTVDCDNKELISLILSRAFFKPMLTIFLLFVLQQYNGINFVCLYSQDVIRNTFGGSVDPFALMIVMDLIRTLSSVALCCFGKFIPYRKILFSCTFAAVFSLFCIISILYLDSARYKWLLIIFLVGYVAVASAILSIAWPFVAVIFPIKLRGLGAGISTCISGILFFISIQTTPYVVNSLGIEVMYVMFIVVSIVCAVILYFVLPEINGKSLQEIEDTYHSDKNNIKPYQNQTTVL